MVFRLSRYPISTQSMPKNAKKSITFARWLPNANECPPQMPKRMMESRSKCVRRNVSCWNGKLLVVVQMLVAGSKEAGLPDGHGVGGHRSGKKMVESPRQSLMMDGAFRVVSLLRD